MKRALRLLQIALVGVSFLFFWGGGMLSSWFYMRWVGWREDRDGARHRVQRFIRNAFRLFCDWLRVLRLIDVDPRRHAADVPDGPYVLVANHPTLIDVIALIATYDRLCVVVKDSLINGIMVGRMLRLAGYINGGGSDGTVRASDVLAEAEERLEQGFGVLIFPEGTRSPPREMHPFMRTPFEIAARSEVPVIPVFIQCEPPALMKGVPWYRFPNAFVDYQLNALDPISVSAGRSNVRKAMNQARDLLLSRVRATTAAA